MTPTERALVARRRRTAGTTLARVTAMASARRDHDAREAHDERRV